MACICETDDDFKWANLNCPVHTPAPTPVEIETPDVISLPVRMIADDNFLVDADNHAILSLQKWRGWEQVGEYIATAINEHAEMKQLLDESRTPLEIMELLAAQQLRTAEVDAENSRLASERQRLREACKKALTCASINGDVRNFIQSALQEEK